MAKKTSASRSRKSSKGSPKAAGRSAASGSKKATTRPKTKKKSTKKVGRVKAGSGKATPKKAAGKAAPRKKAPARKTAKKTVRKAQTKKTPAKKAPAKKVAPKKPALLRRAPKPAAPAKADRANPAAAQDAANKSGRKGITIVADKPRRPPRRSRPKAPETRRPVGSQLLGPGSPKRSPLIPSGPKAPKIEAPRPAVGDGKVKSPFKKRELDKFRNLLIAKRRSLVGDVSQLETEALRSSSGALSHTPQHMAEQGTDSADQSLSLGLAAADRRLIKEIDAALQRIDEGRFGICELTGRAIRAERLKELPWARYSIEAARQRERNMTRGNW